MHLKASILGVLLAAAIVPHARAAVTENDFLLRNTADLVALCSAGPGDPMASAAVNFCNGFTIGVVRTLEKVDAAERSRRAMFCLPANRPSRSAAITEFVHWANADPSRLSISAEDGVATFLSTQYPCRSAQ